MSLFIGIDIGASFIKGAILDSENLKILNVVKSPTPIATGLRFEIKGQKYVEIVRDLINELIKRSKNKIAGIVFSSQMHGMILVDSNLDEITPFIGWQDGRILEKAGPGSKTWLDLIDKRLDGIDTDDTGIKMRSGLMGTTLFWLKENGTLKKNKKVSALFLGDYVTAKLTNGKLLADATQACGSGIYDVKNGRWDKKILEALGLRIENLPEIVSAGTKIGDYKYNKTNLPVYVSIGDLQAAVLGSLVGFRKQNEISINVGTGSQVSYVDKIFKRGDYEIRSYFDNLYLNTITHLPAGRALNVLIKLIEEIGKERDIWKNINQLTKDKKSSNGLKVSISFFKNNASNKSTGRISNITEHNLTVENIFYSAYDNMADNYFDAYKKLVKKPNREDRIICSGGLIRKSKLLQKLIKEKFNTKINQAPLEEETLAGLMILSMICKKQFKTITHAVSYVLRKI